MKEGMRKIGMAVAVTGALGTAGSASAAEKTLPGIFCNVDRQGTHIQYVARDKVGQIALRDEVTDASGAKKITIINNTSNPPFAQVGESHFVGRVMETRAGQKIFDGKKIAIIEIGVGSIGRGACREMALEVSNFIKP